MASEDNSTYPQDQSEQSLLFEATGMSQAQGLGGLVQSLKASKQRQVQDPKYGLGPGMAVKKTTPRQMEPETDQVDPEATLVQQGPAPSMPAGSAVAHPGQLAQQVAWLEQRLQEAEQAYTEARSRMEAMVSKFEEVIETCQQLTRQNQQLQQKVARIEQQQATTEELPAPAQEGFAGRVAALEDLARQADEAEGKVQMLLGQRKEMVRRQRTLEDRHRQLTDELGAEDPQVQALSDQIEAIQGQLGSLDRVVRECKQLVVRIYQHIEFGFKALAQSAQQSSGLIE